MQCEKQRLLGRRWNFAIIVLERRGILQGLEPYRLELAWPRKEFSRKSNRLGSNTTYINSMEISAELNEAKDDGADKGEGGQGCEGGEGSRGLHVTVS